MTPSDHISRTFSALADPTRRAILARLALGEVTVNQLAEPFDISLPAISKHLKVLEGAGLVTRGRDAQRRPVKLEAAPMAEAAEWLERYRNFWERRYQELDVLLEEMQGNPAKGPGKSRSKPRPRLAGKRRARH